MQTDVAQPAIGAVSLAMFRLLSGLGVQGDFYAGHSYGEYVALCAAGVFGADDLLRLSARRGQLMHAAAQTCPGAMAALAADFRTVESILAGVQGITAANLNSPKQTVISGAADRIAAALEACEKAGVRGRRLPVACAFHSPLVAAAAEPFAEFLATMSFCAAARPVFSNTTGRAHADDPAQVAQVLATHLQSPVRFQDEVEAMYAAGARIFVEVGPQGILASRVHEILEGRPHLAVASDRKGTAGLDQLANLLAQLVTHGVPLALDRLFAGRIAAAADSAGLGPASQRTSARPTTWVVNGIRSCPIGGPEPLLLGQSPEVQQKRRAGAMSNGSPSISRAFRPTAGAGRPRRRSRRRQWQRSYRQQR